ncbi:MAG: hypothetical protein OHK0022_35280 [Roseiflexaceae bacterium]
MVASQRPPGVVASEYVTGVTGLKAFSKLGCAAAYDTQQRPLRDGVVILFFGQPMYKPPFGAEPGGYGTSLPGVRSYASIPQIRAAVQAWIDGYLKGYEDETFSCAAPTSGLPRRTLVIATTNERFLIDQPLTLNGTTPEQYLALDGTTPQVGDPDPTLREHGIAWGQLINLLSAYVTQQNGNSYLTVTGGNDIELAWNGPTDSRIWIEGYYEVTARPLYVAGACDGCPDNPRNAPASGPYSYGWTAQDIWTVVALKNTVVIPQIYREDGIQARQWATLATVTRSLGPIRYAGALTQFQACVDRQNRCTEIKNTPQAGWSQFTQALKDQGLDSRLPWLTDVRWEFDEEPFQKGGS